MCGTGKKSRTKSATAPPRVCSDCFWKRLYLGLEKTLMETRRQVIALMAAKRAAEMKKSSPVMPRRETFREEFGGDVETERYLDNLGRRR